MRISVAAMTEGPLDVLESAQFVSRLRYSERDIAGEYPLEPREDTAFERSSADTGSLPASRSGRPESASASRT